MKTLDCFFLELSIIRSFGKHKKNINFCFRRMTFSLFKVKTLLLYRNISKHIEALNTKIILYREVKSFQEFIKNVIKSIENIILLMT